MFQVAFSIGAVYLKWGLQGAEEPLRPVVFALFREALASPPLLMICRWKTGVITPPRADVARFLQIGFLLYLNQLLFIWGLHLSGAVMATCMQVLPLPPDIPIDGLLPPPPPPPPPTLPHMTLHLPPA